MCVITELINNEEGYSVVFFLVKNSWFAKGRKAMPSTGFLEERLRNIRKRLRAMNRTPQAREDSDSQLQSGPTSIPGELIITSHFLTLTYMCTHTHTDRDYFLTSCIFIFLKGTRKF